MAKGITVMTIIIGREFTPLILILSILFRARMLIEVKATESPIERITLSKTLSPLKNTSDQANQAERT